MDGFAVAVSCLVSSRGCESGLVEVPIFGIIEMLIAPEGKHFGKLRGVKLSQMLLVAR